MNDSELALLALIAELKAASGYGLASVARARGMERWAGLSASSVYKGLRRLEGDGLVKVSSEPKKRGRGPPGRVLALTAAGSRSLRRQLSDGLLIAPEQSTRYRLSLAFIEVVVGSRAIEQLRQRSRRLRERIQDVERARAAERGPPPLGATLLFEYVLLGLEHERVVTARLIHLLKTRSRA